MKINNVLEGATSKRYKLSEIDVVPMSHLHTTLEIGSNEDHSFLLKCYTLQNPGSADKTTPITKDYIHHQVKKILIQGLYDGTLDMGKSCVGVVIRSPKNLNFYRLEDYRIKALYDIYNITLFSNSGLDFFPNVYVGKKDSESRDVEKGPFELYGLQNIESAIINFEHDALNDFRDSEKTESDIQKFLNSFYDGNRVTIPKSKCV